MRFCDEESQRLFLLGMPMLGDLTTPLKLHLAEVTPRQKLPTINRLQNWYFNIIFDQFGRMRLKRLLSLEDYDNLEVPKTGEGCHILIVRKDGHHRRLNESAALLS